MKERLPRPPGLGAYLRAIAGAACVALGSLAVAEARSWNQVLLTIGVTEWGHVVAALGLAALGGPRNTPSGRIARGPGLAGAALSLSSLARGALVARRLPAQLATAFGDVSPRVAPGAPARPAPLVLLDVLRGVRSPRARKQRRVYAERDGLKLALDLYRPDGRRPATDDRRSADRHAQADEDATRRVRPSRPVASSPTPQAACVVVVHGGSWQSGDSRQFPRLNAYLAARGYVVAAINYRLSPGHRFPAQRDDVLAAIGFLKANAAELGIDPTCFVLLGRSAGGHLALLAAYTARDPAIRGVISFYAPTDLRWGYEHPARKRVIDGCAVIEAFLGGGPTALPDTYPAASPLSFAGAECPPTLLIHGARDNLVSPHQSEMLAERLAAAGCRHFYLSLPWATHGCDANFSGPSGQISTYAIERFLAMATGAER